MTRDQPAPYEIQVDPKTKEGKEKEPGLWTLARLSLEYQLCHPPTCVSDITHWSLSFPLCKQ